MKLKMAERRAMRGASIMEQKVSLCSPCGADDAEASVKEEKWIRAKQNGAVESHDVCNFSSSMDKDVADTPLSSVLCSSSGCPLCPLILPCLFGFASDLSQMSLFAHVVKNLYK